MRLRIGPRSERFAQRRLDAFWHALEYLAHFYLPDSGALRLLALPKLKGSRRSAGRSVIEAEATGCTEGLAGMREQTIRGVVCGEIQAVLMQMRRSPRWAHMRQVRPRARRAVSLAPRDARGANCVRAIAARAPS